MTQIEHAILKTLVYADIFSYPLTEVELWRYLITDKPGFSQFRLSLQSLLKSKQIARLGIYYVLRGRTELISQRRQKEKVAQTKIKLAQKMSKVIGFIPTVYFVGISGSLAMKNTAKDDDIDLFIITAPGCLWLTRFVTTILLDLIGVRRKPGEEVVANKICLNMFISSKRLLFPNVERSLYLAHEISQLTPLVDKYRTHARFLQKNRWLLKFLPHIHIPQVRNRLPQKRFVAGNFLELVARRLQISFMAKRRTTEKISAYALKFHPQNMEERVLVEYQLRVKKVLSLDKTHMSS